jgi:hypothetical protein
MLQTILNYCILLVIHMGRDYHLVHKYLLRWLEWNSFTLRWLHVTWLQSWVQLVLCRDWWFSNSVCMLRSSVSFCVILKDLRQSWFSNVRRRASFWVPLWVRSYRFLKRFHSKVTKCPFIMSWWYLMVFLGHQRRWTPIIHLFFLALVILIFMGLLHDFLL